MEIDDFHLKLPKDTFTLKEWGNVCIGKFPRSYQKQQLEAVTFALIQGINNLGDVLNAINILKEKLSRASIKRSQKTI
jgi:hypothetical protein